MKRLRILFAFSILSQGQLLFSKENCDPAKDTACPNFEFWNKLDKSVYFTIGAQDLSGKTIDDPMRHIFLEEKPNQWANVRIDQNKQTIFCYKIGSAPTNGERSASDEKEVKKGDKLVCYKFTPGKTVYIRVKGKMGDIEFGPQTGPLLGLKGKTERGYPLGSNVKKGDKQLISFTYQRPEIPTPNVNMPPPPTQKPAPEPEETMKDPWNEFPEAKAAKKSGKQWQHLVLGVSSSPTEKDVKSARNKLALKWHPDKHPNWTAAERAYGEEVTKIINNAFQYFKDKLGFS